MDHMEKRRLKQELLTHPDPDKRPWMYDCDGRKVVQGDFTTPWTKDLEEAFLKEEVDD